MNNYQPCLKKISNSQSKQNIAELSKKNRFFNVPHSLSKVEMEASYQSVSDTLDLTTRNARSKPQIRPKQQNCVICSDTIYRQVRNGRSQWYCSKCHDYFADSLVQAFNQLKDDENDTNARFFCNRSRFVKTLNFHDPKAGYCEHVVFPGQTIVFSVQDQTRIRIRSNETMTNLAADTVLAKNLPKVDVDQSLPLKYPSKCMNANIAVANPPKDSL